MSEEPTIRSRYIDLLATYNIKPRRGADGSVVTLISAACVYCNHTDTILLTESVLAGAVRFEMGDRSLASIGSHHAMVHESLHPCGPDISPDSTGIHVPVEELITELAARHVTTCSVPISCSASISIFDIPRPGYAELVDSFLTITGAKLGHAAEAALRFKQLGPSKQRATQVLQCLIADISGVPVGDTASMTDEMLEVCASHWTAKHARARQEEKCA